MEKAFLLNNALLIDPEGDKLFLGALEIKGGLISKIYSSPQKSKIKTIDCAGMFLGPGIIDIGV